MDWFLSFFLGIVTATVECARPADVLNACAAAGIALRQARPTEKGLALRLDRRNLAALQRICTGLGAVSYTHLDVYKRQK